MSKKILLIENDQELVGRLTASLEAAGFEVRVTGDGKQGLELARDWAPGAVVLCVELPGMSGYLVCQKLKKDDALKAIPLVLTSAEATEETFEKHRTLKARANDYLLKPYEPPALVEKLGALVGLPEGAAATEAPAIEVEELVSLEEEIGMAGEPGLEIPPLELESLPDEPSAGERAAAVDEDLRLLDDAFDGISSPPAGALEAAAALDELAGEKPVAVDEVDAAAASLPDEDEGTARAELGGLDTDAALGALADVDETLSPGLPLSRGAPPAPPAETGAAPAAAVVAAAAGAAVVGAAAATRPPVRGASADLLRAAGIRLLDEESALERGPVLVPPPPEPPAHAGDGPDAAELARLRGELDDALAALERVRADLGARDGELRDVRRKLEALGRRADDAEAEVAQAKARAEAAQEKAARAEADAKAGRDEARRVSEQARAADEELAELRQRAGDLERRAGEAERRGADAERRAAAVEEDARRKAQDAAAAVEALSRAETLEREADELRTELLVARGEAEGARGEIEKRTAELKRRVVELEAANAKNEERVVKAYQKIKADEKVRDKVRKALAIATHLLEEGLPAESQAEKDRRAAAAREERP